MEVNSILICGGIAIFTLILQKLASGEGLKDFFLKNETEKKVSKEKSKEVNIESEEQASKKQTEKIEAIVKEKSKEVEASKKETDISNIKTNIDSQWDEL